MKSKKRIWAASISAALLGCLLTTGCEGIFPSASPTPAPGTGGGPAPSVAPTASPSLSYVYDSQFGTTGTGNGQFNNPYGLTIDASNYLYIVDSNNMRVQKFTSSGLYQAQWNTQLSGETVATQPTGITVGNSGGICVLDTGTLSVKGFNASSGLCGGAMNVSVPSAGTQYPMGITYSGSNYYVTDSIHCWVQVFTAAGSLSTTYTCNVAGGGATQTATGVAVIPGEAIFIADETGRVKKFGITGTFISYIGNQGSAAGQMQTPIGLGLDSADNLFVLDATNNKVVIFTKNGSYLGEFGSSGAGNGQLDGALGIAIDKGDGSVYISDTGNNRIQKFVKRLP
jgi:tripartite motif-containing protein 71